MSENLNSTNYEEIITKLGGNVDELPDRLETTYLKEIIKLSGGSVDDLPDNLKSTYLKRLSEVVGSGSGGSGSEYDFNYNPTWWDIKKIVNEDTEDYPCKLIFLLNDSEDVMIINDYSSYLKNYLKGTRIKFSDNLNELVDFTIGMTHQWDTTKDKPCYINGKSSYATRYLIIYFTDPDSAVLFYNLGYLSNSVIGYYAKGFKYFGSPSGYGGADSQNYIKFIQSDQPLACKGNISLNTFNYWDLERLPELILKNSSGKLQLYSLRARFNVLDGLFDKSDTIYVSNDLYISGGYLMTKFPTIEAIGPSSIKITGTRHLKELNFVDTAYIKDISYGFQNNTSLETIKTLNLLNATAIYYAFNDCKNLKNLTILNIKLNLQIGSGTSWGHLLTLDSLINTCKECIKTSSSLKLTVGSENLTKLANVYVKFTNPSQTEIAEGEKGDVVVCESTDEGAMLISDYMQLKSWTLT